MKTLLIALLAAALAACGGGGEAAPQIPDSAASAPAPAASSPEPQASAPAPSAKPASVSTAGGREVTNAYMDMTSVDVPACAKAREVRAQARIVWHNEALTPQTSYVRITLSTLGVADDSLRVVREITSGDSDGVAEKSIDVDYTMAAPGGPATTLGIAASEISNTKLATRVEVALTVTCPL